MLCKVLKVPRSVYYYHQHGKVNSYEESNKKLDWKILGKYNNAIVMDLYSLSVIGYSYGKNMDADLVIKAIENARKKENLERKQYFIVI